MLNSRSHPNPHTHPILQTYMPDETSTTFPLPELALYIIIPLPILTIPSSDCLDLNAFLIPLPLTCYQHRILSSGTLPYVISLVLNPSIRTSLHTPSDALTHSGMPTLTPISLDSHVASSVMPAVTPLFISIPIYLLHPTPYDPFPLSTCPPHHNTSTPPTQIRLQTSFECLREHY